MSLVDAFIHFLGSMIRSDLSLEISHDTLQLDFADWALRITDELLEFSQTKSFMESHSFLHIGVLDEWCNGSTTTKPQVLFFHIQYLSYPYKNRPCHQRGKGFLTSTTSSPVNPSLTTVPYGYGHFSPLTQLFLFFLQSPC